MKDKIPVEYLQVLCPCCHGKQYQYNKLTGINIVCPCCKGTGLDFLQKPEVEFNTTASWDKEASKTIKE